MTLHYHGTPITPAMELAKMAGKHFCVSFAAPHQVRAVHGIGQSVMLDNGAFSMWRKGKPTNWPGYYGWADIWLDYPTTWAVIPDVIDGGADVQDDLLAQWPHGERGAPVWHMDEPIARLLRLIELFPRICIGSSGEYANVLSPSWERRMDNVWREIAATFSRTPNIHMLRGMQLVRRHRWPFASVDSTDVARNFKDGGDNPKTRAERWDRQQCPPVFHDIGQQGELAA